MTNLSLLFLCSGLAAVVLIVGGRWRIGRYRGQRPERTWLLFLLIGACLLVLPIALSARDFITGDIELMILVLIPHWKAYWSCWVAIGEG